MADTLPFDWRTLRAITLGFLAIKVVLLVAVQPFMDETYYWMWGQHPGLSYFDHPPMVAWLDALSAAVFGWSRLALRVPVVVTFLGDLWILYLFARRLGGADWRGAFWLTALIFVATPVFMVLTTVTLPDHVLILFSLAALYCFHRFLDGADAASPRWRWLYLGAVAVGLALLSKYYAVLLAGGLLLAVLVLPRYRWLLRTPHFYAAVALALVLQAPVVVWNVQHDFASFGFIFGGRRPLASPLSFTGMIGYLLGIPAMLSPLLLIPLARYLFAPAKGPEAIGRFVFWTSTVAFFVASIFTNILVHWNLIAYIAVLPFLFAYLRSRLVLMLHLVYCAICTGLVAVNYAVVPVVALIGYSDQTSAWSYGWDEVAAEIARIRSSQNVDFIAATDYGIAGQLGFILKDRDVTSLAPRRDAFDDWFDASAHAGQNALILADRWRSLPDSTARHFDSVEEVGSLRIVRFGARVDTYRFYLGTGYKP
jgi:4-amino-4-deoxy-L-arabinose transferase-like glycosyltransferase